VELGIVECASDNTIGRVLKKRASAPSQRAAGYSAGEERRFRSGDGGRARRLYAAARSGHATGLPGRDLEATRFRDTNTGSDEAGAAGAGRLRVRAKWDRQAVHVVCSAGGWRHVEVTDRRTAIDYAKILKDLSDYA
jgi:hypothetical protein